MVPVSARLPRTVSESAALPTAVEQPLPLGGTRVLRVLVGIGVAVMVVMGQIGAALSPKLVVDRPLVMLVLSANTRYLLLVTNQLGGVEYAVVAMLRRSIPITLCFIVGWWYGPRALGRFGRRASSGRGLAFHLERGFRRAGWAMVVVAPVVFVAILAGVARLDPRRALPLMYASIAARLVVYRVVAAEATGPIDQVLAWIRRWQAGLIVISVLAVVVTAWSHRRRGTVIEEIEQDLLTEPTLAGSEGKTESGVTAPLR